MLLLPPVTEQGCRSENDLKNPCIYEVTQQSWGNGTFGPTPVMELSSDEMFLCSLKQLFPPNRLCALIWELLWCSVAVCLLLIVFSRWIFVKTFQWFTLALLLDQPPSTKTEKQRRKWGGERCSCLPRRLIHGLKKILKNWVCVVLLLRSLLACSSIWTYSSNKCGIFPNSADICLNHASSFTSGWDVRTGVVSSEATALCVPAIAWGSAGTTQQLFVFPCRHSWVKVKRFLFCERKTAYVKCVLLFWNEMTLVHSFSALFHH